MEIWDVFHILCVCICMYTYIYIHIYIYIIHMYVYVYIYMEYHDIISWEFHYGYHGLKWGYIRGYIGGYKGIGIDYFRGEYTAIGK